MTPLRRYAVIAAALAAWIAGSTLGAVAPASAPRAAAEPLLTIGVAHAGYTPSLTGTKPIFILVIGSGARPGEDVTHSLSDALHIIGINPAKHAATILDIPRDSWVEIPGRGMDKINAAMVYGGPGLTVQTVETLTGIKIDYYALTTFWGMTALIDGIGGLTIDVPFPMHDHYSGADFSPGVQRLNGRQVLAFTRDRHSIASGDFGRTEDQGRVILAALAQFRKEFTKDPSRLLLWLGSGLRNIQTNVPLPQLLALAFTAYGIKATNVQNITLPGGTGVAGSQSVVYLSSSDRAIYDDMRVDGLVSPKNVPRSPTAGA